MSEEKVYPADSLVTESAWVNEESYKALYNDSVENPETFWADQAKTLEWLKPFKEAEAIARGHRTDMDNDMAPYFLQEHHGQFMYMRKGRIFEVSLLLHTS